jgi:transketolase
MRDIFVKNLFEIAKKDPNVLLVTGDLGYGVLREFWEKLPNQIINIGIAEQNMIGFASGLSISGKVVYVYSIANFSSLRPLEQIRNDVAYHNLNVKIVSIGSGLSYGALGMSHHATEDLAVIRSIPNIRIYSPCDNFETANATDSSYTVHGPAYIRLGRNSIDLSNLNLKKIDNSLISFKEGNSSIAIFCHGDISSEVMKLYYLLNEIKISPSYYFFNLVTPLNKTLVNKIVNAFKFIFIIEEHNQFGGLSSIIKDNIDNFNDLKIYSLSIANRFVSEVGNQDYLRKVNRLDSVSLFNQIKERINFRGK